jgi:hypothetical protein
MAIKTYEATESADDPKCLAGFDPQKPCPERRRFAERIDLSQRDLEGRLDEVLGFVVVERDYPGSGQQHRTVLVKRIHGTLPRERLHCCDVDTRPLSTDPPSSLMSLRTQDVETGERGSRASYETFAAENAEFVALVRRKIAATPANTTDRWTSSTIPRLASSAICYARDSGGVSW